MRVVAPSANDGLQVPGTSASGSSNQPSSKPSTTVHALGIGTRMGTGPAEAQLRRGEPTGRSARDRAHHPPEGAAHVDGSRGTVDLQDDWLDAEGG